MGPSVSRDPTPTSRAERWLADVERLRRERPEDAVRAAHQGFASALRTADPARRGEMWRMRGHVLRGVRRAAAAAECYRRAERWFARARNPRERGRCAIGLVDSLMYAGRYGEAIRAAARGRRLLVTVGDHASLARLANNEGNLYHRLDLPTLALRRYRDACRFFGRTGDARGVAMVEINVANCLALLGRSAEARPLYERAVPTLVAKGLPLVALDARYNLAYLDFLDHRYERAIEGLEVVGREGSEHGYPSPAALAALDRAEILLRMGAYDDARDAARDAAGRCAALGLAYERAKAETFAALAEHRLGQRGAAGDRLARSLETFHGEGNAVWIGETLVGLATLWGREGNPRAAAALLAAARRHFRRARDREREGCCLALLARTQLACDECAAAARSLAAIRRASGDRPSARLRHLALAARAAFARAAGDAHSARRLLRRAAIESERLAARILDEHWRASFWGDWGWPHLELAMLELRAGRVDRALEALEGGRGRALVGPASARARGAALPVKVRRWASARFARERHRLARSSDSPPASGIADRPGRGLARALRSLPARPIRAAAVRRALDEGQLLIDYFVHDDSLGAIAIRRSGLEGSISLARERRVTQLAHSILFELRGAAFRQGACRSSSPTLEAGLAEIADLILPRGLSGAATPSVLSVLPVGPLARLPWAALPLDDGSRLCERVPTVLVPGLRLGLIADRVARAGVAGGRPLIVGSPGEDLEHVRQECEAVSGAFPSAHVLTGAEATTKRFLALAPSAAWIHFAGHGAYRPDSPHSSALRFSDRWMSADEMATLRLSARWVTLSACDTARALVRPGEEWFGLSRAMLLAGAGAVLAAQWDVDDDASARFMTELFRRLARQIPLGRALAETQAARRREGANPLDWAGFALFGGLAAHRIVADGSQPPVPGEPPEGSILRPRVL
jgi:tetratricopeptide (TPR) repeat protein